MNPSKPERRIGYCLYEGNDKDWNLNKIRSRIDLVFEVFSTSKRVWRLVGSDKPLSDEWVAEMIGRVKDGRAQLVYNRHFKSHGNL